MRVQSHSIWHRYLNILCYRIWYQWLRLSCYYGLRNFRQYARLKSRLKYTMSQILVIHPSMLMINIYIFFPGAMVSEIPFKYGGGVISWLALESGTWLQITGNELTWPTHLFNEMECLLFICLSINGLEKTNHISICKVWPSTSRIVMTLHRS